MSPKRQGTLEDAVIELIDFSHFFNGCSTLPVNSASLTHIINPSNCSGIAFVSKETGCDLQVTGQHSKSKKEEPKKNKD